MSTPVVLEVNVRRGLSSKCSLYSVDPSCGSASSFVIPVSCRSTGAEYNWQRFLSEADCCGSSIPAVLGVMLPGVDHGDDTLGGLGSYVKIDAISAMIGIGMTDFLNSLSYVPPYIL